MISLILSQSSIIGFVICTLIRQRNKDVSNIIANENEYKGTMKILTMSQPTYLKMLFTLD